MNLFLYETFYCKFLNKVFEFIRMCGDFFAAYAWFTPLMHERLRVENGSSSSTGEMFSFPHLQHDQKTKRLRKYNDGTRIGKRQQNN